MKWKLQSLADVSVIITKGTTPTTLGYDFSDDGIPFLRVQNIDGGRANYEAETLFISEKTHAALSRSQILPGDVLVSIAGSIGRAGIVPDSAPSMNCNQAVAVVRPSDEVCRNFLRHWLESRAAQDEMTRGSVTGTIANLSLTLLRNLQIPLPPLAEQKRIAAILDAADALRNKRREALAQLDVLTQSLFLDLFGDPLDSAPVDTVQQRKKIPRGCKWRLLTDVARLATGHTPDRERTAYWNGEIPWISLTDIRNLNGRVAGETLQSVSKLGIENSSAVLLPKGTVCFSRTASVGYVTVMGAEMCTSQDFMNWVCGPDIDPIFLMWALIASRNRLLALSSGSTHRTIYMRVVEQFRVLLPSINQQRAFSKQFTQIESQKEFHRAHLAELDSLFASLQHRAFRGEL